MNDISEILHEMLDRYGPSSQIDEEFLAILNSDNELNDEYKAWCKSHGYATKNGFREYINELIESRDSLWDNYKEYGNEI